jgi:nucleoid-associated protein YgaU
MALASSFQKARLEIEGSGPIPCLFNPKDFTITKNNSWEAKATPGATAGKPQFGGGQPQELQLQLLFDASLLGDGAAVRDATERLFKMMDATQGQGAGTGGKKNTKRPPKLTFVWGRFISFAAFAKSLKVQYQLFAPDGQPLRADVTLSLVQADAGPAKGQNPTTRADDGSLGGHVVREGDSLPTIAHRAYGDATRWRAIAEANGIDDPMVLRRGTTLALPRLEA